MRFKIISKKGKRLWHSWFAWRPVKVGGWTWVWLEWVSRRRLSGGNHMGPPRWEYRLPAPRPSVRDHDGTEYYQ